MSIGLKISTTNGFQDITEFRAARLVAIRLINKNDPSSYSQYVPDFSINGGFLIWLSLSVFEGTWNEATKTFNMESAYSATATRDGFPSTSFWLGFMRFT